MFILLCVAYFLTFILLTLWWYVWPLYRRLPPELVLSIPIIGHFAHILSTHKSLISAWRRRPSGPITRVRLGLTTVVLVKDFELVKELLVGQGAKFAHRPRSWLGDNFLGGPTGSGIAGSSGFLWDQQRRFTMKALRTLGMDRQRMEDAIRAQTELLCNALERQHDAEVDLTPFLVHTIANIDGKLVLGRGFSNEEIYVVYRKARTVTRLLTESGVMLIDSFPFLRFFPLAARKQLSELEDAAGFIDDFFERTIEAYALKQHGDDDNDNEKCYIGEFLKEIDSGSTEGRELAREQLGGIIQDIFMDPLETTVETLRWIFAFIASYPSAQDRMYQEITSVIGDTKVVEASDRYRLPYTRAVINEAQRLASVAEVTVAHTCLEESTLGGYTIPQGTVVLPVLAAVHMDPSIFENPKQFMPERFLDENGALKKCEQFIPFGFGKRACIGQSHAELELFVVVTSLVQKFRITAENPEVTLKPVFETLRVVRPYKVAIRTRNPSAHMS